MRFLVLPICSAAQKLGRTSAASSLMMISSYSTSRPQRHVPSNNSLTIRKYCQTPEAVAVDFNQVKKATKDSKILIVDVREPDEVKEHGKIENSINIPLGHVTTVLSTVTEKEFEKIYKRPKPTEETEIIFYCMIGKRSGMAQQNALNLGFKNAKNYLGSWLDWANKTQGK